MIEVKHIIGFRQIEAFSGCFDRCDEYVSVWIPFEAGDLSLALIVTLATLDYRATLLAKCLAKCLDNFVHPFFNKLRENQSLRTCIAYFS